MKTDPYYQRQKCRTVTVVAGAIRLCGYLRRFPWHPSTVGLSTWENLSICTSYFLRKLAFLDNNTQSFVGFSVIPKCMTLILCFALNSVFAPVWLAETVRLSKNNCVKTSKDRHILSAGQIFVRDSSSWQYKIYADIRSGSLEVSK